MNPRIRAALRLLVLLAVTVLLLLAFPIFYKFAAGAAHSVVRLWWLVLLLALAVWLIWGMFRRPGNRE